MARPRKPPESHRLSGNAGKRSRKPAAAAPVPPEPADTGAHVAADHGYAAPATLSAGARAIWLRELPRLRELGFIKQSDLSAFGLYCDAAAQHRDCNAVLQASGYTYTTGTGFVRARPEVAMVQSAERTMLSFQKSLAMTADSRLRAAQSSRQGDLFGSPRQASPPAAQAATEAPGPAPAPAADPVSYFGLH